MQSPTDVGGQLLGFWTGQQHAEVKRPQELVFSDPMPSFHHFLVHDGYLAGWSAEADEAQLDPKLQSVSERNSMGCHVVFLCDSFRAISNRHQAYKARHRPRIASQKGVEAVRFGATGSICGGE